MGGSLSAPLRRPPEEGVRPSARPRCRLLAVAILAAALAFFPVATARAADLVLNDEPEVYAAIDKLNAAGYLPGLLANTRPYSMEAVREALQAASHLSVPQEFDGELFRWLVSYTSPKTMGRITAAATRSDSRFFPANNEGIPVPKDWGGGASLSAREEKSSNLSAQVRAASFLGEGDDEGNRLLDTSIEVGSRYIALQAGKLSTWYGPGRHGALILTNNAAPYPGIRLHDPVPIPMPGWFSFLGNLQYDIFAARMEKKPQYSHSIFVGTRLAARPAGWLEVGLSRVLHYGGDGRDNGIDEFITDYCGNNDPSDRSNTLGGFDITLTLPFSSQPVQLYWDRAGEGENRLLGLPWPSQWGNLLGIYLPRILGVSRADLRAEYADNYSGYAKTAQWYDLSVYPHFYRGNVLGHSMGGGSRDWYVQARYFFLPAAFAEASYEIILHDFGVQSSIGYPGERRTRYSAGGTAWLSSSWRTEAHVTFERVANEGGIPGFTGGDFSASLAVSYQVSSFTGQ